jgi:D-alanyl-D-alanine carboxypeptidase
MVYRWQRIGHLCGVHQFTMCFKLAWHGKRTLAELVTIGGWQAFQQALPERVQAIKITGIVLDKSFGNPRGVRRILLAVLFLAILPACTTTQALNIPAPDAKPSKYAAIVVDAHNGKRLYSASADVARYPASLTKMMTLYLLFEAMEDGRVTKSTRIPVSRHASRQPPSKLGLKAGQSIDADTAIRAMVVKSANDVAAAVAEFLGGSEDNFALRMTQKAKELGMYKTSFRNASGLPDKAQITSAYDMSLLALALRQRFPQYYHYFSLREFTYGKRRIRGHNKALDMIAGANGLKTGYTRASGFNLATSVSRSGRDVVAIVMGGNSARSRDAHMAALIEKYLPRASRPN